MQDGSLDEAPIWSDVCTFDGRPWRGSVDLVAGGFPCQDVSSAGKRRGLDGERSGLWWEYHRIVREVQPRWVFIENVEGLAARGLGDVLEALSELGYDAEWGVLAASEVGAPHRRKRLFILAWRRESSMADCMHERSSLDGGERADDGEKQQASVRGRWLFPLGRRTQLWRGIETEAQPCVHGVDDGLAKRVDRIRACGNGVVALQGAAALDLLARRAGQHELMGWEAM
jgi:DNA (cytosine-5)-methyltransferase 1